MAKPRATISFTRPQLTWIEAKRVALGLNGISDTVRRLIDVQMEQEEAAKLQAEAPASRRASPEG